MESWRTVLREGFFPGMSKLALQALLKGLEGDDPNLIQGATTSPPPLMATKDYDCCGGCLIGYAGWASGEASTVGEVEEYFARQCFDADQRLGEPAACRYALNAWDDGDRQEMRRELIGEIELALKGKA